MKKFISTRFQAYSQEMTVPIRSQLRDIFSLVYLNWSYNIKIESKQYWVQTQLSVIFTIEKFVMNIESVQISRNSINSLWIITFAINEIKENERLEIEYIIVDGIMTANIKRLASTDSKRIHWIVKGTSFEIKNANINEWKFSRYFWSVAMLIHQNNVWYKIWVNPLGLVYVEVVNYEISRWYILFII